MGIVSVLTARLRNRHHPVATSLVVPSTLLYVHTDSTDSTDAQDVHLEFHTVLELLPEYIITATSDVVYLA